MASNPLSARRLPPDDPFFDSKPSDLSVKSAADNHDPSTQYTGGPSQVIGKAPNTSKGEPRPEADPALYTRRLPQTIGPPGGYLPLVQGNSPYQSGWNLVFPPLTAGHFPQVRGNQRVLGLLVSPNTGGNLPQTPTNQLGLSPLNASHPRIQAPINSPNPRVQSPLNSPNPRVQPPSNSPNPRVQSSAPQPPSVKHLTCWYWANKGCKLADDVCLYAHFDTGRLADPPVKVQRGREFSSHRPSL